MSNESSITVAVRIRPFTAFETLHLTPTNDEDLSVISSSSSSSDEDEDEFNDSISNIRQHNTPLPNGIWKLVDCVDDKMLIFDPVNRTPLNEINVNVMNKRRHRRGKDSNKGSEIKFIFDKIFDMNKTQEDIYEDLMIPLLDSVMMGYNGTIFAYGATGCGKTYTISGREEDPGLIYRTMDDIFNRIKEVEGDVKLCLSFCEIYNENIIDLLKPETPSNKLIIREDCNQRIKISNLSTYYPSTVNEVIELVSRGNMNRTTHATEANNVSSRSHSILQITIEQTNMNDSNKISGILSIIDLAGSERAAMTKNRGNRLIETGNINKSLLALGNCINSLCQDTIIHVPYRDSKLTRLLQFSLGGNCKTVMIVCISPSSEHYDETLNTLKYANRAKRIKTKSIKNEISLNYHVGSYVKIIESQKKMIEKLLLRVDTIRTDTLSEMRDSVEKKYIDDKDIILQSLILVKRRFLQLINLTSLQDTKIIEEIHLLEERFEYEKDKFIAQLNNSEFENEIVNNRSNRILIKSNIIMEDLLKDTEMIDLIKRGVNNIDNLNVVNLNFNKFSERYFSQEEEEDIAMT